MGAVSSSASRPAKVEEADLAAVTALCIISRTPILLVEPVLWDDVVGAEVDGVSVDRIEEG